MYGHIDLVFTHFRSQFGRDFRSNTDKKNDSKRTLALILGSRPLFSPQVTWKQHSSLMNCGARIHATGITDEFTIEYHKQNYAGPNLPLFCMDKKNNLHVLTGEKELPDAPDWTVIAEVRLIEYRLPIMRQRDLPGDKGSHIYTRRVSSSCESVAAHCSSAR